MDLLQQLEGQLAETLLRDRFRLGRRLQQVRHQPRGARLDAQLARLQQDVAASIALRQQRVAGLPEPRFDQPLPILEKRTEITAALLERQTIIVAGETGSGKSTQLPQIALAAGFGAEGMIGHTQPRRIAAQAIATRVAEELRVPLGQQVGYKIRFTDRTQPLTYVKVMTDGILLAETQTDRFLEQYQLIILDEAHERSLNIDFLIGYLKQLLVKRKDLQLVITSATIDAARFSQHFADADGPAPVIEVSGRCYPVEVRHRPLAASDDDEDPDASEALVAAVQEAVAAGRGDVLVFLPTERDIRETARRLRGEVLGSNKPAAIEILPLYARLSAAEQNRIFHVGGSRRIVLATNVAESSLTVPNIHYVVDTGTARISRYSPRSKVQRLPIEAISRASADQRKGRCGRLAPGICIRLYSEDDYLGRDAYTTPEIHRTNLASVILQAKALQLGEVDQIPFLDPPHPEAVRDGYKTLFEIGAVDERRELTDIGRRLARMPVDPRIGRMILAAEDEGCLHEVLIIAAALETQDPRERPHDRQQQADQRQEQFLDPESDFLSYLKLWEFYHHLRQTVSRSQLRKACQQNYLSYNRMREWNEIHRQLLEFVNPQAARLQSQGNDFAAIHRSLLAGLLSGVAYRSDPREYTGAGGIQLQLWPGSGLAKSRPQWIMAAELVETSRRYARTVARISPQWIERLADHLVKRSYSDPRWRRKARAVIALEKVSLFGLPVIVQRPVRYRPIDSAASRQLFIQGALVDQQLDTRDRFYQHNRRVREELADMAAKTRRRDYLLDDYTIFQFYDQRIPADVCDWDDLQRWLKKGGDKAHADLMMAPEDFVVDLTEYDRSVGFPEQLQVGSLQLPVTYHFEHGSDDDGVTIAIPAQALGQMPPEALGWLVPGLLEEKVIALIRALPKELRRNFVPVPDTARRVVPLLEFGRGSLIESLAQQLSRLAHEYIPPSAFELEKLPNHLKMNLRILDENGQTQCAGRDLESLRRQVRDPSRRTTVGIPAEAWTRDGILDWDFGDLPADVSLQRGSIVMTGYPALVDQQQAVGLRLFSSAPYAGRQLRQGLTRLYFLAIRKSLRSQVRWLPQWDETCVWAASVMNADELKEQLQDLMADQAFLGDAPLPRSEAEYRRRLNQSVERIALATQEIAPLLPRLFQAYHRARLAIESLSSPRWQAAREDLQSQTACLVDSRFLTQTDWKWLQHYPRYLAAIEYRVDKLKSGGEARDLEGRQQIEGHWQRYRQQREKNVHLEEWDSELNEYRWMLEEYRVSWFAQPLGTAVKISLQRLDKQWTTVRKT